MFQHHSGSKRLDPETADCIHWGSFTESIQQLDILGLGGEDVFASILQP